MPELDLFAEIDAIPDRPKKPSVLDEIDAIPARAPAAPTPKTSVLDEIDSLPAKAPTPRAEFAPFTPQFAKPKPATYLSRPANMDEAEEARNPLLKEQFAARKLEEAYSKQMRPDEAKTAAVLAIKQLRESGQEDWSPAVQALVGDIGANKPELSQNTYNDTMSMFLPADEKRRMLQTPHAKAANAAVDEEKKFESPTIAKAAKVTSGLMEDVGDVLDRPSNAVRSTIAGSPVQGMRGLIPFGETLGAFDSKTEKISAQEMNKRLGLQERSDYPLMSVPGGIAFGEELALDPLNLLGFGVLTKSGKVSKAFSGATDTLKGLKAEFEAAQLAGDLVKATSAADQYKTVLASIQKAGNTADLAKTPLKQAEAGQRAAVQLKVPFTDLEMNANLPGLYKAREKVGEAVKSIPGVQPVLDAFKPAPKGGSDLLDLNERVVNAARAEEAATRKAFEPGSQLVQKGQREVTAEALNAAVEKMGGDNRAIIDMVEGRRAIDPAVAGEVAELKKRMAGMGQYEQAKAGLKPMGDDYFPRQLADGGESVLSGMKKDPAKFNAMVAEANQILAQRGQPPVQFGGTKNLDIQNFTEAAQHEAVGSRKFTGLSTTEWNDLTQKHYNGKLFSEDAKAAVMGREMKHNLVKRNQDFLEGVTKAGGAEMPNPPSGPLQHHGKFQEVSIYGKDQYGHSLINADRELAGLKPVTFRTAEEADMAGKLYRVMNDGEQQGAFEKFLKETKQIYSGHLTRGGTRFSLRNRVENVLRSSLEDVPMVGNHRTAANKFVAGSDMEWKLGDGRTLNRAQLEDLAMREGVIDGGFMAEAMGSQGKSKLGLVTGKTEATSTLGKVGQALNPLDPRHFLPTKAIDKVSSVATNTIGSVASGTAKNLGNMTAESIEQIDKMAHWLKRMELGDSPTQAAQSMKKALGDYSGKNLGAADKFLDKSTMFYKYTRNVIPYMAGKLLEKPGAIASMGRLGTQPGKPEHTPEYIKEGVYAGAGTDKKGDAQVIGAFGTPFEGALEHFAPFKEGIGRGVKKLIGSAHPAFTIPAEGVSGKDTFLNRDIEEVNKPVHGVPFADLLLGEQTVTDKRGKEQTTVDPWRAWAVRKSPWASLVNTLHKAADPRKEALTKVVGMMSPMRINSIDVKDAELRDAMKVVDEELSQKAEKGMARKNKGGTWEYTKQADEETRDLLRLRTRAQKELGRHVKGRVRDEQKRAALPFEPPIPE